MANVASVRRRVGVDLLCGLLILGIVSGCTTVQPIHPTAAGAYPSIKPGDKLKIVARDGRELRLVVTSVTADSVVGDPQPPGSPPVTIAFSEIRSVEKVQFSPAMAAPAAGGFVAFAFAGVFFTMAALLVLVLNLFAGGAGQAPGPSHAAPDPAAP